MIDLLPQPITPTAAEADPQSWSMGLSIEAGFRRAVTRAIQQTHEAGLPVSYLDDSGRIVWLVSDGKTYPSREAAQVRDEG